MLSTIAIVSPPDISQLLPHATHEMQNKQRRMMDQPTKRNQQMDIGDKPLLTFRNGDRFQCYSAYDITNISLLVCQYQKVNRVFYDKMPLKIMYYLVAFNYTLKYAIVKNTRF